MSTQATSPLAPAAEAHNRSVIMPPVGSPEFFQDPHRTYRSLREQGPLVSLRPNLLACTRYGDCQALLRDSRFSSCRHMRPIAHFTEEERSQLGSWTRVASHQVI